MQSTLHPLRRSRRHGFTLVEIMVALVIMGIVASLGVINYLRLIGRANYASCVTNKRNTYEASLLYIAAVSPGTVTFDVDVLTGAGLVSGVVADCPSSSIEDHNDYTIEITLDQVTAIDCKIEPADHSWRIP